MRGVTQIREEDGATRARPWGGRWPLERALFALAGTVTVLSAALGAFVSPWFLVLAAFVGVSQWAYAAVGECPASMVLVRATGLRPGCAR